MSARKESSRALFETRRDTVKLIYFQRFASCEKKVAVPPSSSQLTTIKLDEQKKKIKPLSIQLFLLKRDISTLLKIETFLLCLDRIIFLVKG